MLDVVVQSYETYLLTLPTHRERFQQRVRDHPSGARAEAAVFVLLRAEGCEPLIQEDTGTGGADFCCTQPSPFIVEVTSLDDSTIADRAGIDQDPPDNGEGGGVELQDVLNLIRTTASNKASQLANYPVPRVLAICAEHWGMSMFFGPSSAKERGTADHRFAFP